MPSLEAPCLELGSAPRTSSTNVSPSPSEISSASSPEPPNIRVTPLFRVLAMRPSEPDQPTGQDELERRLPGYRRIVIPRELTLIEILKQSSGVTTDEEVLRIREVKLRVIAERVGLRRLHILAPRLRNLTLDGSAIASLRDLGIGLVHLKVLSINRCNINSLDGVWGLGALKELYAAGNRIQDLQPLAALQKLHSLDLSDNPIAESSRLWTLAVCGALRKLKLNGTPASNTPDYRSRVASALPMLVYLDERPLHTDIDYDYDEVFSCVSSDSECEGETHSLVTEKPSGRGEPGPSTLPQPDIIDPEPEQCCIQGRMVTSKRYFLCRPATTENAGVRPARPNIPVRPRTAQERPVGDAPTRLQILNTLMDNEWLSSGSKLTSLNAVCGNITRALRRTSASNQQYHKAADKELIEQTIEEAARAAASEIPRAPKLEDWIKFKEETGIEIDLSINHRLVSSDPSKCLDRLEQIEKETQLRLKEEWHRSKNISRENITTSSPKSAVASTSTKDDLELLSQPNSNQNQSGNSDVTAFIDDIETKKVF